jgi:aminomethyltransferase
MAYVATDCATDGTPLEIEVRGKRLMARVVPMPFKPKNYVRA